ncbi:hypothetical protein P8452_63646 [Trifolium repens]|nr:hypothetical protein P8452_56311 [Trifolium repens]WJX80680.1 hypothetical protein P8452_63646 [Trifolium repens]
MKEPLLEKKQYYKDCPGCKVEQEKELNQGVSIIKLLIIWMDSAWKTRNSQGCCKPCSAPRILQGLYTCVR